MFRVYRPKVAIEIVFLAIAHIALPIASAGASERALSPSSQQQMSRAVIAVVSLKNQRISLYDAFGVAVRAHVSTGQTGLETPAGVYAVLQKKVDHHSNVYYDAAMPFMQRITWTGLALHAGALPGYPASHGCVRLPYSFAQQIFPITRLGMRVVVSPDDFSPVAISHPFLPTVAAPELNISATPTSFNDQTVSSENPFQPDLGKWPERQTELDALKVKAGKAAENAETTIAQAAKLKIVLEGAVLARAKAAKVFRVSDIAKRAADDQLASATAMLQAAQVSPSAKKEADAKGKALLASQSAGQAVDEARIAFDTAERKLAAAKADDATSAPKSPRQKETKRALEKQAKDFTKATRLLRAAELAKKKANDRVAETDRALFQASRPRPTTREEAAKSKALASALDAQTKRAVAEMDMEDTERRLETTQTEFDTAERARVAAAETALIWLRRTQPVSLFVSLKAKRLYVRQGHAPVLDVPIAIADSDKPIGTHVYTAVDFNDDGDNLRWTAVAVGRGNTSKAGKTRAAILKGDPAPTDVTVATSVLDRLTMPPEVLKQISGYVWPGSSLIVSDEPLSPETGNATDFIVVMNNEPLGGLRSRANEVAAERQKATKRSRDNNDDDDDDRRDRSRRRRAEQSSFFTFW